MVFALVAQDLRLLKLNLASDLGLRNVVGENEWLIVFFP